MSTQAAHCSAAQQMRVCRDRVCPRGSCRPGWAAAGEWGRQQRRVRNRAAVCSRCLSSAPVLTLRLNQPSLISEDDSLLPCHLQCLCCAPVSVSGCPGFLSGRTGAAGEVASLPAALRSPSAQTSRHGKARWAGNGWAWLPSLLGLGIRMVRPSLQLLLFPEKHFLG